MAKRVGKYEIRETLGEGTFGKVKLVVDTETGQKRAIKILLKEAIMKQHMQEQIKKEIAIMKKIQHKNVVNLIEVLASRTKIFIVLELVTGGELFQEIVDKGRFNEDLARKYFQQLLAGMEYCHSQGVCHRDLKPENLLLSEDGTLKISDFGLSSMYADGSKFLHTTCGTPNYVAPEVLQDKGYKGEPADIWSCGVILYVLVAGYLPFDEPSTGQLFKKIMKAEFSYPAWFSKELIEFLNQFFQIDPAKRITIEGIKRNAWFSKTPFVNPGHQQVAPVSMISQTNIDDAFTEAEESESKKEAGNSGPVALNAFELIAMGGALDLAPMFNQHQSVKRYTRFSTGVDVGSILPKVQKAISKLDSNAQTDVNNSQFKMRSQVTSNKHTLTFVVQVFQLSPKVHMVEFRRGKGDMLEFYRYYKTLYSEGLQELALDENK